MKKIISILLTTSMLAGSAAMPFTAIAAETTTTASQASEAAKTGTLTVTVYNEDEGDLYTDEQTSFMISGSPDQTTGYGMGGATFLCSVIPSESNPFVLNDIDIISNTNYTIIDSGSPDYDGFNYRIDYERSDRTFKFTENPNQDLSIYMKKNYFVVNSDKSVTVATHGQDIFDNMQAVMSQTLELINSDDFKALATADRISKAKELMKSLSDDELIADYAFDAEKNVMSFTYKCGTITGQLRPAVFEDEHKQLNQKGTKTMTLDDVKELAKKGDELTWSDFEKYEFTDIGDGTNIWQFVIKNSRSKLLVIGRDLKEKPEHINCVWGNGAEFDIRTEDLTPWFYDDSSSINGDANSNGNETCYSGGECEDGVMIVPETEDGKIVTEISLWSDDNIKALKIPATVNNVDIIKCLNLEKIEVSEDNPYLCSVDGVIYSKDMKTLVFYPSSKSETAFIVPDTVEVIREGAFSYAQNLKSVKLPYGVKIIKDSAFFGTKITDFELPETLTDIEQYAFSENNSLTSITLPSSLKHAERPFSDCETLTEIVILHEIGDEHFESSGPRNPDDDYYRALLSNGSNITVFVPDNSYEDYNKYYKDRWKCKNVLPLSKYEKITIKGDTNCDGSVDMADAVLIMQALANPNKYGIDGTAEHHLTEQGKLNGDMDGNGLTVGDAQSIQRKLLGLSDTNIDKSAIAGKIFAYEKEGAGGYCTLSFSENGRFLYYPGKLSSYMDGGDWKVDGDTVSLIGMENKTIYLKITDDTLVYIAEGSDEFPYMDIKDGEKFNIYRPEISADKFQLNSRYSEYGLSDPKVELDLIVSELPEFCYVEDVRLYDEDDNFIGMMSPAMDADIWNYLVDCHVTEECSKTYYTLSKIRCGEKTYLDDVRSEITVNFKVAPAP